jgi:hypothetical protein
MSGTTGYSQRFGTIAVQSVHFTNGNPAKSMKTSHGENFNRYTLSALQGLPACDSGFQGLYLQTLSLKRISVNCVTLWQIREVAPGLEIDAND